ncbi:MAG: hypothetical protein KF744_08935 [Taibaiella sp.]|nr:hypothetical protein [Taibaiella sp.]
MPVKWVWYYCGVSSLIDTTYTDDHGRERHVEVVAPAGNAGGGYYVYVNGYFQGQIVLYTTGWNAFVSYDYLTKDDVDAIMDVVAATSC